MRIQHREKTTRAATWCVLLALLLLSQQVQAATSALSRWLSREAIPDIAAVLGAHPRAAGRQVELVAAGGNSLDQALVTVLLGNLGGREDISIAAPESLPGAFASSVDELHCGAAVADGPRLSVAAEQSGGHKGRVVITLADGAEGDVPWRRWEWRGALSRAENSAVAEADDAAARGTLSSPWGEDAVDRAARALATTLACDLKPQLVDRVALDWGQLAPAPAHVTDVFNVSRHLVGGLAQVDLTGGGDFTIETRVQSLQNEVLQVWLVGVPRNADIAPVQAVTYIRGTLPAPVAKRRAPASADVVARPPAVVPAPVAVIPPHRGPAREFIDVRMLDLNQSDRKLAAADLSVQLQLVNRGSWPIQYAFSISGGHYLNCVAEPGYYRHDRYGYIEGEIPAGESQVRAMQVTGVQHNPTPWFGPRKCAGFKDLEGFENFNNKGYKVTEYVRWRR